MKIVDIKMGQKVKGYYQGNNKIIGEVVEKLKTVVYVQFNGNVVKYDKAHLQFLTPVREK